MPRIRSVRTAARTMIGSWTNSMVDHREDLIARQTPAKTTPTPIKTASARRTSAGVEGVHLLPVAVLQPAPAGGGVEGAELGQALLLGRQGGLKGVRKLGVVHGDHPEAGFQLQDFDFSSGEF